MAPVFKQIPVLIVGAGPTGLVMALWLTRRGVPVRIIDQSASPGLTSRALAVQARTLEFYQQLGLADELIEAGVVAREVKLRRKGKQVATARLGAMGEGYTPFPYLLFCSQDVHEKFLAEKLAALGVKVERKTKLVGLVQDEARVIATLERPDGSNEQVEAQYLSGCDGAHSTVRRKLGIPFEGGTYSHVFYVADVAAEGDAASGGVQISVSPEDFCIVMPIKQLGSVRLTGIVPPAVEGKEGITFEDVRESVTRNTGLSVSTVNWFSSYHVHHRVAGSFKLGRVFLAGDAGHIHSPAGGQGMNTGIGDAINLAWKLADVLQGRAGPELLDTYEEERIAFARKLVKTTDTAFRFIASRSWIGSIFRAYVLPTFVSLAARIPFVLRFMFRTVSQIKINYRGMRLARGGQAVMIGRERVEPGERVPPLAFAAGAKTLEWGALEVDGKTYRVRPDRYLAGS